MQNPNSQQGRKNYVYLRLLHNKTNKQIPSENFTLEDDILTAIPSLFLEPCKNVNFATQAGPGPAPDMQGIGNVFRLSFLLSYSQTHHSTP